MCGILGYIGEREATDVLVDGLRKLEYRGYDSAGVVTVSNGAFQVRRSVGKLSSLDALLRKTPADGRMGLGHTRWATHGAPSEINAHPHVDGTGQIVIVHNGIIENFHPLKQRLQAEGAEFKSETDTEVVAHLVSRHWKPLAAKPSVESFILAVRKALAEIEGTFALGIMCSALPDVVVGTRRDCPLIVGLGQGEQFLASDVPAILSYTRDVVFLEDGDIAVLRKGAVEFLDAQGRAIQRKSSRIAWDPIQAEKSGYKHFMMKEIYEQPRIVEDTLRGRLHTDGKIFIDNATIAEKDVKDIRKIRFLACGTSWHASLVGAYWIEQHVGIPCQVDIASEFRYRDPIVEPGTLAIAVSQSGETADTLAAIRLAKKKGAKVLSIANVIGSSMTREGDGFLLTHCGPEIGVASTKAFQGQLTVLYLIALYLAELRKSQPAADLNRMGQNLARLSRWLTETLQCDAAVAAIAKQYHRSRDFLFLGRHVNYPIALEGALKLKEISYIHAEGYAAGEMKHGPIALISEGMPIVAIATRSKVYDKMVSNIEEARSRGAAVIAIANKGDAQVISKAAATIEVPEVPEDIAPMINVVPLQLLAYHIASLLGCDVDQPRNLAKSVTVE